MPVNLRASKKIRDFDAPVSYRIAESRPDRLIDARNVFSNQGILNTRHGMSRFNATSLGGNILSLSYFQDTANNRNIIAKVGTILYKVNSTGACNHCGAFYIAPVPMKADVIDPKTGQPEPSDFASEFQKFASGDDD